MAVDKMWDVLRFLRTPQKEEGEGAEEAASPSPEELKLKIDSKLEEALKATEAMVDLVSEEAPGQSATAVSHDEEGVLLPRRTRRPRSRFRRLTFPPRGSTWCRWI